MNWFTTGAILSVTGATLYWYYSNLFFNNSRSILINDLTKLIKSVPNKTVIHACNRYRKLLIQYECEIEDIFNTVDKLMIFENKKNLCLWEKECNDKLNTHVSLLKKYSQDFKSSKEELLTIISDQNFSKFINNNYSGLIERISKQLIAVTCEKNIECVTILKFLVLFLDKNNVLSITEFRLVNLFKEIENILRK